MKKIRVITQIIFYREQGDTSIFISDSEEAINQRIANLEFKGFKPTKYDCLYKWEDGLYLRTSAGAPWAVFTIKNKPPDDQGGKDGEV